MTRNCSYVSGYAPHFLKTSVLSKGMMPLPGKHLANAHQRLMDGDFDLKVTVTLNPDLVGHSIQWIMVTPEKRGLALNRFFFGVKLHKRGFFMLSSSVTIMGSGLERKRLGSRIIPLF